MSTSDGAFRQRRSPEEPFYKYTTGVQQIDCPFTTCYFTWKMNRRSERCSLEINCIVACEILIWAMAEDFNS
eukprot:scaffold497151_cov16-Prasinocladus_malaysianus.AAC.1